MQVPVARGLLICELHQLEVLAVAGSPTRRASSSFTSGPSSHDFEDVKEGRARSIDSGPQHC